MLPENNNNFKIPHWIKASKQIEKKEKSIPWKITYCKMNLVLEFLGDGPEPDGPNRPGLANGPNVSIKERSCGEGKEGNFNQHGQTRRTEVQ